ETQEDFKQQINDACKKVDVSYVRQVIEHLRQRVRAIEQRNDNYIFHEHS
ncbi:unnamed protein product, partial [Rotaria magnacalcarata]